MLASIENGDPAVPGAHPAPVLSAGGGYTEADLADDLGLDSEDQLPPDAVTAYLDAAGQTFWHETERIAREHLAATAGARARGNRDGAGPVSARAPRYSLSLHWEVSCEVWPTI